MIVEKCRKTSTGLVWWTWGEVIPPIPPELLDSVFYLYKSESDAEAGAKSGGTGFVVSYASEGCARFLYGVTNQHVVGEGGTVMRFNTRDGAVEILASEQGDWHPHQDGDDLAVIPLAAGSEAFRLSALPTSTFISQDLAMRGGRIGPGDDVCVLGRFIAHDGRQQNEPTVRFGHIARLLGEPIITKSGIRQESFLVEMLSLPGNSGSPVLVYRMAYGAILRAPQGVAEPLFLGVDFCHLQSFRPVYRRDPDRREYVHYADTNGEKLFVQQNSGMMGVIPAWKLTELLELGVLKEMREKKQRELSEESEHVALDVEGSEESEFDRFEDLARKLVAVPKTELDEKRKERES